MRRVSQIETEVLEVVERVGGRSLETDMTAELIADLGFDSLKRLELVEALEDHFDVSISLNSVPSIRSVGDVVNCMSRLVGAERKVKVETPDPS